MSGNTEIIREQIAGERGRKVTPSDAFKARLAELLAGSSSLRGRKGEGEGELIIVQSGELLFL